LFVAQPERNNPAVRQKRMVILAVLSSVTMPKILSI
jgi:hypothetical protein